MTHRSKRELERALEDLAPSDSDEVFEELWKRSAADEVWREDEEFMSRLQTAVEEQGWPASPWRER